VLTYDRFVLPAIDTLRGPAPPVPAASNGRYCGEVLDLNRIDVGEHLRAVQESRNLAPQVVIHLQGSGEKKTSPIRWKGANLVLCVDAPERDGMPALVLAPRDPDPSAHAGWIDVEDGNLDVIGMEVRCPDFKTAALPPFLFHVRGGNLRLHGCRLHGPREQAPYAFRALIDVEGTGQSSSDHTAKCTLNESVLVSGKNGIHIGGTGAHLAIHQCVIVSGGDAVVFDPGRSRSRMNLYGELDHITIATAGQALRLGPVTGNAVPLEPLVVVAQGCAFLSPFAGARAGLFVCDGESLARGALIWQGDGNVFDKRLHSFIQVGGESPEHAQSFPTWARLWGPANEKQPIANTSLTNVLKWEPLQLDRLLLTEVKLPPGTATKLRPGADLAELGLLPKPAKPK
jgi:hypothetical protein